LGDRKKLRDRRHFFFSALDGLAASRVLCCKGEALLGTGLGMSERVFLEGRTLSKDYSRRKFSRGNSDVKIEGSEYEFPPGDFFRERTSPRG